MPYPAHRHHWLGCFSIAVACLVGCDAYPSEDLPLVDPFSLSPAARLQRLNQLGQSQNAVDRWRYQVRDNCALAVSIRSKNADWDESQIDLHSKDFRPAYRYEAATYEVQAGTHTGPEPGIPIFSGKDRGTALEVTLLVKLLARDCQSKPGSPAMDTA